MLGYFFSVGLLSQILFMNFGIGQAWVVVSRDGRITFLGPIGVGMYN